MQGGGSCSQQLSQTLWVLIFLYCNPLLPRETLDNHLLLGCRWKEEGLQVPSPWPVCYKGSGTVPAVAWPHVLQRTDCPGWSWPSAAAAVPAAPIADCMAATTVPPHLSLSHLQHPRFDPQGWWGGGKGFLGKQGWKGQAAPYTDSRRRGCIAVWDEQSQIPGPDVGFRSQKVRKVSNVKCCSNYSDRGLVKQLW